MRLRDEYAAKVQSLTEAEQAVATLTEETADLRLRGATMSGTPVNVTVIIEYGETTKVQQTFRTSAGKRQFAPRVARRAAAEATEAACILLAGLTEDIDQMVSPDVVRRIALSESEAAALAALEANGPMKAMSLPAAVRESLSRMYLIEGGPSPDGTRYRLTEVGQAWLARSAT